ncbi:hypothetical protein ACTXT7_005813 [Hymenolepis weldensis]
MYKQALRLPEMVSQIGDTLMDSIKTVNIAAIVRSIMEQMNLSKPDKDPGNYIKDIGEFYYEPSVGEIFETCILAIGTSMKIE